MLPTDTQGQLNWEYMENTMKQQELKQILAIIRHFSS